MRAEFLNLENVFSREGEVSEGTHSRADLQEAIAFPRLPIAEENFSFTAFLGTFLSRGTATEAIALARRALFQCLQPTLNTGGFACLISG
jgi:hypothetical protein